MNRIVIARTDSIGDVMLTIPMAGILKAKYPETELIFIGKSYTEAVIKCCKNVDQFINWDILEKDPHAVQELKLLNADLIVFSLPNIKLAKLAWQANIKNRVGVSRRWFHWVFCNDRPQFSRRKSDLHEAQLNIKLLEKWIPSTNFTLEEIASSYGFSPTIPLPERFSNLLKKDSLNIILHPKSQGSAREWGVKNFQQFANLAVEKGVKIFVTGTESEGQQIRKDFRFSDSIIDLTGKMNLHELIAFINATNGLVAASTGPLHLSAALGKIAIGLYSTLRPIHPGRWAPLGPKAKAITYEGPIDSNLKIKDDTTLELIPPDRVLREFF
ncbi:MAG: glycosyltransferase family 9 protein [Bacteroidetes bacterium]|jgi:ADP-heptose:LPS heptosyltransferase|nr:glycosyltransferase family 9 protein [Bacteroidota bacterium]